MTQTHLMDRLFLWRMKLIGSVITNELQHRSTGVARPYQLTSEGETRDGFSTGWRLEKKMRS
jgi:hypothetical protein